MTRTNQKRPARSAKISIDELKSAVAYATPTASATDWDAWAHWVKAAPAGLTIRARSEFVVRAANGDKLDSTTWRQLIGGDHHDFGQDRVALPAGPRQTVYSILKGIAVDFDAARRDLEQDYRNATVGSIKLSADGKLMASTMHAALVYGIWLFLTDESLGRSLCFCRYRECGKLFFEIGGNGKRGRPQRLYCDHPSNHGYLEDNAKAAERMEKRRMGARK